MNYQMLLQTDSKTKLTALDSSRFRSILTEKNIIRSLRLSPPTNRPPFNKTLRQIEIDFTKVSYSI